MYKVLVIGGSIHSKKRFTMNSTIVSMKWNKLRI